LECVRLNICLGSSIRFLADLFDFFLFRCTGGEVATEPELELVIVNSGEGENLAQTTDYTTLRAAS